MSFAMVFANVTCESGTLAISSRLAVVSCRIFEVVCWISDGVTREGFIAHEVAEVIPSAVEGAKDAENQLQSLNLDAICAVLVKAVQEQQATIEALEARIEALETT